MIKSLKLIVLHILFGLFLLAPGAQAEDVFTLDPLQEVKAAVSVGALIPTNVSETYSSIWTNVDEALADLEHGIIVTVELKDKDDLPLPGLSVELTSNRGDIDNIIVVNSQNQPTGEDIARTDAAGRAYFRVTSAVPGEATLSAVCDTLVTLPLVTNPAVEVTFLPLPFPENITISLEVPTIIDDDGKLTVFRPSKVIDTADKSKLVNMGAEIVVPFWLFLLFLIAFLIILLLLIYIVIQTRKIRALEKKELAFMEKEDAVLQKEEQILEKIEEKEGIPKE